MKLVNLRHKFSTNSTIGTLYVDGVALCNILEPADMGLEDSMTLSHIIAVKNPRMAANPKKFTAIPIGIYPLKLVSGAGIFNRFPFLKEKYTITGEAGKKPFMVPELQNIKDYAEVLLHPGNYPRDTEGCSLVGKFIAGPDFIGDTPDAFYELDSRCFEEIAKGGVTYEIQRDAQAWAAFQYSIHS
jgi:hypothetical protein